MKKELKHDIVKELSDKLSTEKNFYLADISSLNVARVTDLRKKARKSGIEIRVVKNTLIKKALQNANIEISGIDETLRGPSTLIFAESINAPAKFIKEFRGKNQLPSLKAAYIEESFYVGDDKLETLIKLKSREELIADIVFLLQSPMRNVIGGLQSGGQKIAGILKTLSEKED